MSLPVQTVTWPFNTPSPPYTSAYATDEERFMEVGKKPQRDLPANPSQQRHHDGGDDSSTTEGSLESSPEVTPSLTSVPLFSDTPGPSPDTPASLRSLSYKPLAPPKKARNLKNLAVNTTSTMSYGRAFSTAALPMQKREDTSPLLPGPATASFIKPFAQPRRISTKLGLTLKTPTMPDTRPTPLESVDAPPTPSLARPAGLRRFQSSPLIPLNVPGTAGHTPTPIDPVRGPFSDTPSEFDESDHQRFDIPQSREEKLEAYPDGPICIYDPNIYLYLEPTLEEASGFDVVLNVASEVMNPFPNDTSQEPRTSGHAPHASDIDATSKTPEYIHIPWEHNTDIVPDLYRLVQTIDDRVQQGKRVLIHCQCGVSRSASLIVAYGLYKNPSMTVQQAYDAVKRRSKWIGPNMSLIMQLQEFRTKLLNVSGPTFSTQRARSKTSQARLPSSGSTGGDGSLQSAPLQHKVAPAAIKVVSGALVTPGPSSAPSNLTSSTSGSLSEEHSFPAENTSSTMPSGHALQHHAMPFRTETRREGLNLKDTNSTPQFDVPTAEDSLFSPRNSEFSKSVLPPLVVDDDFTSAVSRIDLQPSAVRSPAETLLSRPSTMPKRRVLAMSRLPLVEDTPSSLDGVMSPRATEFAVNPFLQEVPAAPSNQTYEQSDPRSPPPARKGSSASVLRNIFDVL